MPQALRLADILYELYDNSKIKCKDVVVFNGKMQTKKTDISWYYPHDADISNRQYVYFDDSYFSGRTVEKINKFLSEYNSKIKSVNVVYDGSLKKKDNVHSFYRYYR